MLEQIALSISTAIFFVCAFIVNSLLPSQPAEQVPAEEPAVGVFAFADSENAMSLEGKWHGGGKTVEFTADGKIICEGITADYRLDGQKLTVKASIGGNFHEYSTDIEIIDGRNIRLGELTLHKVE